MTDASLAIWIQTLGGVAVAALGAFVLSVRPRNAASLAFGTFAFGFGGYYSVSNAVPDIVHVPGEVADWIDAPLRLAWTAGVVAMALVFPTPLARRERRWLVLAAVVTLVLVAFNVREDVENGPHALSERVSNVAGSAALPALVGFLVLLCARYLALELIRR